MTIAVVRGGYFVASEDVASGKAFGDWSTGDARWCPLTLTNIVNRATYCFGFRVANLRALPLLLGMTINQYCHVRMLALHGCKGENKSNDR